MPFFAFSMQTYNQLLFVVTSSTKVNNTFVLQVCAYNRTVDKVEKFLANEAKGTKVIGAKSIDEMVAKLKKPKRIMLLVKGRVL